MARSERGVLSGARCRNTLQGARGGKGFVPVGQQSGVLVAFATEPGKTASDIGYPGVYEGVEIGVVADAH